jgi:peptidyl-prolyl cis-trans isomerase D
MAVINRIRKYSWVAVGFIMVAVLSFVLADLLGPGGLGVWTGGPDRTVGSINGEKINIDEFEAEVKAMEANYTSQGMQLNEGMRASIREQAWGNMIFKKSYTKEFEKLGIMVSDKELTQMVQGDSIFIHPEVRRQFTDPKTNKFDKARVVMVLQQMASMPPANRFQWEMFEDGLRKDRINSKYQDLIKFSAYVTKAEAEREYTAQNTKAEVKYVYVPFTSINDSTLANKVTDGELQSFLNKNREKYKNEETRSLDYVVFDVKPSKEDSTEFAQEIKQLARDLATTTSDSLFVLQQSDNPSGYQFYTLNQIPNILFSKNPLILKGGVYGPYVEGKSYKIFKVTDEKEDSVYFVKASHILFKADKTSTDEEKAKAEKQANEILQKIKDGADFAAMAKQYGSDGTASQGGDLGWFPKGQMVKPFEDAVFARTDVGLIPNLVKTDFGYHIIQVTHPKNNKKYKLAIVDKVLEPSEKSKDEVLRKAEELRTFKTGDELRAFIKKNPALILLKADKLPTVATNVGALNNAREVVKWAFQDKTEIGNVSDVFEISEDNKYVVATLTGLTRKDMTTINDFREDLKREIIKQKKAEQIIKKIPANAKTLEEIAQKYGATAQVNTVPDLSLNAATFQNAGPNPIAIGKAMGLPKGKRSGAFADETGVFVLETIKITPAAKIADFSQNKTDALNSLKGRLPSLVGEVIREASNIVDRRYKFY